MNTSHQHPLALSSGPIRDRVPALRGEVAAMQAKLERLKTALAVRQTKLNRLLAQDAMRGAAAADPRNED